MMTALTVGSRFHSLSTPLISAGIGVSQALSFRGLLSVRVAMPSVTSVMTAAVLMGMLLTPLNRDPAYRRADFAAVKFRIERHCTFGKHAFCRPEQIEVIMPG